MDDNSPYQSPYSAPGPQPGHRPSVVTWFMVYAGLMTTMYVLLIPLGLVLFGFANEISQDDPTQDPDALRAMGVMISVVSAVIAVAFGVSLAAPRKRWAWIYSLVIICLGLTSCCIMPFSIGLLIYWLKPETKAYYNYG